MANINQLDELYNFIDRNFWGKGIFTWPGSDGGNNLLHSGCLELEKQGRIYRFIDEPGHVCWMPVAQPNKKIVEGGSEDGVSGGRNAD